ncbi:MAG: glycosyltransferase family 2 protein [Bacteroidetes bacterium]|nr:glycosyltransferase family 2 protein [Bacteroidota bacterium]
MIAVVIPSYKVKTHILDVLKRIGPVIDKIYVVDDACPEKSGDFVKEHSDDKRITILRHEKNLGVGGAVKTGYQRALADGADIIIKLDGDGQMDPALLPRLIEPIQNQTADYVKGNRFFSLDYLRKMPTGRKFGNSGLSFLNKLVSGYWNIMDPTNGFTAISATALQNIPLEKIDNRFFFEPDMLFRLNIIRAVVQDMPMQAVYRNEKSNLKIHRVLFQFPFKYFNRFYKRIFYNYFLRDFNIGSFELVMAILFLTFGVIFGVWRWSMSIETAKPATAGTVLLAGLPIILGFQSLISFLHFDVGNVPQKPITGSD